MRIHRIGFSGFGPFLTRQQVDFDGDCGDELLLIAGPTGSGKSTLLDVMSFALYGSVPRYAGSPERVRSDYAMDHHETEVELEFTVGDSRYRVTRSPRREVRTRRGTVRVRESTAALFRESGAHGEWEALATKPRAVAEILVELLPLNADQFLQVVMLAQGSFQTFLLADPQERHTTLRTLFRSSLYERIEERFEARRKALAGDVGELSTVARTRAAALAEALATDLREFPPERTDAHRGAGDQNRMGALPLAKLQDLLDADLAALRAHLPTLTAAADVATEAEQRAHDALANAERLTSLLEERDALAKTRAALATRDAHIEAQRAAVAAAHDAAPLVPLIRAQEESEHARKQAHTAWRSSVAQLLQLAAEAQFTAHREDLENQTFTDELHERAQGEHERILAALQDEQRFDTLGQRIAAHEEQLASARDERLQIAAELAASPARLRELQQELERLQALAATQDRHRDRVASLAAQIAASEQLPRLTERVQRAERALQQAASDAAARNRELADMQEQRLKGYAGELAEALAPGAPCRVCGSTVHPQKARRDSHISDDAVQAATEAITRADARRTEATSEVAEARAALAATTQEAGDRDLRTLREAHDQAEHALRTAIEAGTEQERVSLERAQQQAAEEATRARDAELTAQITAAAQQIAGWSDERADLEARLETVRGSWESLADADRAFRALLRHLGRVRADAQTLAAAEDTAARADAELTAALAASGFPDRAAVTAARLSPEALQRAQSEVATHERERAVADARADELAAQSLPEEWPDRDQARAEGERATAAANAARDRARALADRLAQRERDAQRLQDAITAALEREREQFAIQQLSDVLRGKEPNTKRIRLEAFVLAERLERIVAAANQRLSTVSDGRYRLLLDDERQARGKQSGLGIRVDDAYTGKPRDTASLSGGEQFLASISLALGLSDVVTAEAGGISLDTLFIDEGFGSLDPDALDTALDMLDGLRSGGRTVAVISHVRELHERITRVLTVTPQSDGTSTLSGAGVVPQFTPEIDT